MTDIQARIDQLANDLQKRLTAKLPIDQDRIQQLFDMRRDRDKALVEWDEKRLMSIRSHTKALTDSLMGLKSKLRPDLIDKIHEEMDKFDIAAVHWLDSEVCPWEDSEAASISAGIIIIANEIH